MSRQSQLEETLVCSPSGRNPPPSSPTSFNLVVCGPTNDEKDGFIFADFLGFCALLSQKGSIANFYPPIRLINTWGISVTKASTISNLANWGMQSFFLKEIGKHGSQGTPIILEGHANRRGSVKLGDGELHTWDFAQALDAFQSGVQVKGINNAPAPPQKTIGIRIVEGLLIERKDPSLPLAFSLATVIMPQSLLPHKNFPLQIHP